MVSKNIEKDFKIEIIASIIENKVLIDLNDNISTEDRYNIINSFTNDIFEFCSFITGEYVDFSNMYRFIPTIKSLIEMQYPSINNPVTNQYDFYVMDKKEIKKVIDYYKNNFGNCLRIKSLKKVMVKSLNLQD